MRTIAGPFCTFTWLLYLKGTYKKYWTKFKFRKNSTDICRHDHIDNRYYTLIYFVNALTNELHVNFIFTFFCFYLNRPLYRNIIRNPFNRNARFSNFANFNEDPRQLWVHLSTAFVVRFFKCIVTFFVSLLSKQTNYLFKKKQKPFRYYCSWMVSSRQCPIKQRNLNIIQTCSLLRLRQCKDCKHFTYFIFIIAAVSTDYNIWLGTTVRNTHRNINSYHFLWAFRFVLRWPVTLFMVPLLNNVAVGPS